MLLFQPKHIAYTATSYQRKTSPDILYIMHRDIVSITGIAPGQRRPVEWETHLITRNNICSLAIVYSVVQNKVLYGITLFPA